MYRVVAARDGDKVALVVGISQFIGENRVVTCIAVAEIAAVTQGEDVIAGGSEPKVVSTRRNLRTFEYAVRLHREIAVVEAQAFNAVQYVKALRRTVPKVEDVKGAMGIFSERVPDNPVIAMRA